MISNLFTAALIFSSTAGYASNLSLDFRAKDLLLKGDFTFKPGSPMKISGSDNLGIPYELEIITNLQKEDIVQFIYKLKRSGKVDHGSVITRKNELANLISTPDNKKSAIRFQAKWTE